MDPKNSKAADIELNQKGKEKPLTVKNNSSDERLKQKEKEAAAGIEKLNQLGGIASKEKEAAAAKVEIEEKDEQAPLPAKWLGSKLQIMKNLFVIGTAWMFQFTAYQSMANLQSSLNSDEGLGTASLSSIYASIIISCLFLPPLMIKNIGLKWSIVISQVTYLLFIAANMYPKWWLLIPCNFFSRLVFHLETFSFVNF
jgi:hypothetical protein